MIGKLLSYVFLLLVTHVTLAEDVILVVPTKDIHNAIKITSNNMAVRKFDKSKLPDTNYLIEKNFKAVINKTVSTSIKAGDPIPMKAIVPLWQSYTLDEGNFSVEMPGKYKILKNDNQSDNNITQTFYVEQGHLNLKQGFHSYQLHYTDYPPEKIPDPGTDNIIKTMRNKLISEIHIEGAEIKHFEENELSLNGYAGIELNAVLNAEGHTGYLHQRLYQVGYRQYYLMVFSPSFSTPAVERNRFFNSFKLLNP